ncbi:AraC family transcriptional regulator [Ruminococcaceae bacterium OttesenSCG-928-L11]|nr:AraC family transcriptional regulator [Ruminococcaceae bacterium OttesenSCG-928-L11]
MDGELLDFLSRISPEEERLLAEKAVDKTLYTDRPGFTVDSRKMLETGRLIALRPHTRFVDFPAHTHNYIEIMYMCKGRTEHWINGRHPVALEAGELLLLSRNASHAIKKAEEGDVAVNFIVLPQFFGTAYEMIDKDNILSRFIGDCLSSDRDNPAEVSHLHFRVRDVLPVQNLVENLIWSILHRQPNSRRLNQITMGLLFLQLLNHTGRIEPGEEQSYDSRLVIQVLREIEENFRDASLVELARELNQPVSRLSKLMREHTGSTYKQLLQEKRLSKTAQMLATTSMTVGEIANYVGYDNTSYFHRLFQQRYNATPAMYRKNQMGK